MTSATTSITPGNKLQELYHAVLLLCSDLTGVENNMSWPPTVEDFNDTDVKIIPASLFNMVAWIVDEDSRNEIPDDSRRVCVKNENICRHVLSIAQDILYCARQGRIKTLKHVLLPIAVQHLTRNAQVVTLLNKFSHGMSYSQVEEVETALAEEALKDEAVPLPTNIDCGASVVLQRTTIFWRKPQLVPKRHIVPTLSLFSVFKTVRQFFFSIKT